MAQALSSDEAINPLPLEEFYETIRGGRKVQCVWCDIWRVEGVDFTHPPQPPLYTVECGLWRVWSENR